MPLGVNDANQVVGYFHPVQSGYFVGLLNKAGDHGFLWNNGQFTVIDYPGAADTSASGLNTSGDIVGTYVTSAHTTNGFRYSSGLFTQFFPNSGSMSDVALAINDAGVSSGPLITRNFLTRASRWHRTGRSRRFLSPPDATSWTAPPPTGFPGGITPTGISHSGVITGLYSAPPIYRAFVLAEESCTSISLVSARGPKQGGYTPGTFPRRHQQCRANNWRFFHHGLRGMDGFLQCARSREDHRRGWRWSGGRRWRLSIAAAERERHNRFRSSCDGCDCCRLLPHL